MSDTFRIKPLVWELEDGPKSAYCKAEEAVTPIVRATVFLPHKNCKCNGAHWTLWADSIFKRHAEQIGYISDQSIIVAMGQVEERDIAAAKLAAESAYRDLLMAALEPA